MKSNILFNKMVDTIKYKPNWHFKVVNLECFNDKGLPSIKWSITFPVTPLKRYNYAEYIILDITSSISKVIVFNEKEAITHIKDCIQWIELHEIDEMLVIDGHQLRDPHAGHNYGTTNLDEYKHITRQTLWKSISKHWNMIFMRRSVT